VFYGFWDSSTGIIKAARDSQVDYVEVEDVKDVEGAGWTCTGKVKIRKVRALRNCPMKK
jgi:hypothetical protein